MPSWALPLSTTPNTGRGGGSQCPPILLFLSPSLEEGEGKRSLLNLKVKNLMPLFGSAKATSPLDSDESLLVAWAGRKPSGPRGEIDWKENTWLNALPTPHLAPLPSSVCGYRGSGCTDQAAFSRHVLHNPRDIALDYLLYLIPSGSLMGEYGQQEVRNLRESISHHQSSRLQ